VVADASVIGVQSDGVIVVARAGVTEAQALAFAMDQLEHVRAPVLGAVLNDIDFRRDAIYDEAYRYYARGTPMPSPPTERLGAVWQCSSSAVEAGSWGERTGIVLRLHRKPERGAHLWVSSS